MDFRLTLDGDDRVRRRLDEIGYNAEFMEPAFVNILDLLVENEQTLFARNGGGGKGRWRPNTDSTLATKRRKGQDSRPMRATGRLERSLTTKGGPEQIREIKKTSLRFGTKLFYAQINNFAKDDDRRRVVLKILPKTKKASKAAIMDHLLSENR